MTAPVTVTLSRDWLAINAAKVARECSEAHITFLILDAKQDIAALTLARQQAASASNAQIAELREALALAEDALRNHACSGFGIPCHRSTEQCRTDCGQMAGEALDAVILARAKSASEAGGV